MRLTNARHSIHDAFGKHLSTPEDGGRSSGKFNSTRWLAHAGTAGLVIRAVMNQPAHLRAAAIFLNAPENTIALSDVVALKSGLWWTFLRRHPETDQRQQAILVAHIDHLLIGYRCRAWNAASNTPHTAGMMFAGHEYGGDLCDLANQLLDVLAEMDADSLKPVWAVIDEEKAKEQFEKDATAERQRRVRDKMVAGKTFKQAVKEVEAEDAKAHESAA